MGLQLSIVLWDVVIAKIVIGADPAVRYYLPYLLGHGYRQVRLLLPRHPDLPSLRNLAVMTG